ncbi:hypothetical protein NE865_01846 [Phthorimaea operculella]|nr:hypothetical protein NE865_01846 [Phthorimaea operculella]
MGKRKRHHKERDSDELYKKIRRLERHIERQKYCYPTYYNDEYYESDDPDFYTRSEDGEYSDSDYSDVDRERIPSVVSVPSNNGAAPTRPRSPPPPPPPPRSPPPVPDRDEASASNNAGPVEPAEQPPELPPDILEALGESKEKDEVFGPKVREEISKRWGKIITEGLSKDTRQTLFESIHIPENFQLLKAPKLNPEISAVCSEPGRKRDKRLEKAQNHLGLGIAALTNLMSALIEGDMEKTNIIKKISETGQILLDLHFQNTLSRRKLTSYCLGKNFHNIVDNVKRDSFLFGENLGDKIKASKTAEKSGLQIKATEPQPSTSFYRPNPNRAPRQGNARGPPRQRVPRDLPRSGGNRSRYPTQTPRSQRAANDRYPTAKTNNKSTRKTQ